MKKIIILLALFGSLGLSAATCHKYNYELGLLSGWFDDDEYTFSLLYCIDGKGNISEVQISDSAENDYLNEPCISYARSFSTEYNIVTAPDGKLVTLTLDWEFHISNDVKMSYDNIKGQVIFKIDNDDVNNPAYTSTAKRYSQKDLGIAGEVTLLRQVY